MNSSTPVNHFTLKHSDLSAIRLLAKNKEPKYTNHATEQTLVRDIFHSEVREVLSSSTNQIVEIQSKSNTPGQKHTHPRALIYDPKYQKSFIVVCSIVQTSSYPEILIITVEPIDPEKWETVENGNPALIRII